MSTWQPIDTAPKDRDAILVSINGWMLIGCWADYWKFNAPKFTHWMPLPEPPKHEANQ